jgi:hypothetical protein
LKDGGSVRQRLLEFVAPLLACASIFALTFAVLSSGSVIVALSLDGAFRDQEFVIALFMFILVVPAAWNGGLMGAITGALYMLAPRRARDDWMAMAIGAAVVLVVSLFDLGGWNWPFIWIAWPAAPVVLAI